MDNIATFQEEHPSLESYWRSVILFGRNVASFKFALAESLIDLSKDGRSDVTLDELAAPLFKIIFQMNHLMVFGHVHHFFI